MCDGTRTVREAFWMARINACSIHHTAYVEKRSLRSARELRRDVEARIPELSDEPDWVADAVDTLLSFESWNRLRHDRRLGRERIRLTLRASLTALLAQRDRP